MTDYVTMARIAEQAERYEDMKKYIKLVATTIPEGQSRVSLSLEERNLFSLAYKDLISSKRNAWRVFSRKALGTIPSTLPLRISKEKSKRR